MHKKLYHYVSTSTELKFTFKTIFGVCTLLFWTIENLCWLYSLKLIFPVPAYYIIKYNTGTNKIMIMHARVVGLYLEYSDVWIIKLRRLQLLKKTSSLVIPFQFYIHVILIKQFLSTSVHNYVYWIEKKRNRRPDEQGTFILLE